MKNYLLLFLFLTLSFGNVNAQSQQDKAIIGSCDVTSNFSYSKLDCDTVKFIANPTSNSTTTVVGYFWNFGDGNTSTIQNPTHNYSSNGNYNVTLTVIGFNNTNGDCCNSTKTKSININCVIVPPCGVSVNGVTELNLLGNSEVAFLAQTQLNSNWSITNSIFVVYFQNGNSSTHSGTINFQGFPQIIIPVSCSNKVIKVDVSILAVNSSGVRCSDSHTEIFHLGVCGTLGFLNKISPNPAKNTLNVDINKSKLGKNTKVELVFYNLNGNIEQKQIVESNERTKSLDVSKLNSGMYILKLISNGKIIDSQKIIIAD